MALRDTQEARGALFTAGALMLILGLLVATFPNGLWFGWGLVAVGVAVAITTTALAWKDWKRPAPGPDQVTPRNPDRFWNAEKRLGSLIGGSAATGIVALVASVLFPSDQRWLIVGISATILVLATSARVVMMQRDR